MSLTEHRLSIMSNIVRDKDLEDLKKYEVYGTSDFGAVAIDYSKT